MMLFTISTKRRKNKEVAPPELVRRIGSLETYRGADEREVEQRLRSMTYGSTNSRITKLRQQAEEAKAIRLPSELQSLLGRRAGCARRLDPAI